MPRMTKETLQTISREIYGIHIPEERLKIISRVVSQTLDALENSSEVELESVEPVSAYDTSEE